MSYAFPTNLTFEEIQSCLADLEIKNFDPNQLTKPTYEVVRGYYEQAVIALMGISRDELIQPDFSLLSEMEYPDLHDESIANMNFFSRLTRLMVVCGVRDFNLNDLYKPEPARLKRNLCAIINFAKFRDEKVDMLNELEESMAEKHKLEQELIARQEKKMAELQRLKAHRAARQAEAAKVLAETAAIAANNVQLNKIHAVLSEEIRTLKAQNNAFTDQAAEAKLTLNSLHNEAVELQDQIVQSPEKQRQAISDLMAATDTQREYYAVLCSTMNDSERKLDMMAKFERELQRCIKTLEDLEAAIARKKEVSGNEKDTKEAIADEERQYNELQSINITARRQLASLQDKLSRIEQQSQLKLDAASALVEEQHRRREAVEAEIAAGGARAAEQEAQIRHWRERAEEVRAASEARVKAVIDKFYTLRRAVSEYGKRLEAAISSSPGLAAAALSADAGRDDLSASPDVTQDRDNAANRGHAALLLTGMHRLG